MILCYCRLLYLVSGVFFALTVSTVVCLATPIQNYESDITVRLNGSLAVKEKVTFNLPEAQKVDDFERLLPGLTWLEEEALSDNSLTVEHRQIVHFLKASFDEKPIGHTLDPYPDSKLYFVLSGDVLDAGSHTLAFEYTVDGQVGYHEKEEWLTWNVTRNSFSTTIEEVVVRVHLPPKIDIMQVKASGYGYIAVGATRDPVYPLRIDKHTLEFRSKAKLEGPRFKVGLTFPFQSFASDYRRSVRYWESEYQKPELTSPQKTRQLLISLTSFFSLLCLMYLLWPKKQKEKLSQGLLIKNYSPAIIGYSIAKKYHPGLFMASLLDLVNEKVIYIEAITVSNHFELETDRDQNAAFLDEQYLVNSLFAQSTLVQSRSDHSDSSSRFKDCSKGHERLIAKIKSGKTGTGRQVIFGIICVAVFIFNLLNVQTDMPMTELMGLSFVTILFSAATFFMWVTFVILPFFLADTMWKKIKKMFSLSTLFAMLFMLPPVVCLFYLVKQTGWLLIYTLLALILLNLLFYILPGILQGTAESLVAEAAGQLKQNILRGEVQVNSQKEYLQHLALSYGLGVQNQFEQQFQGNPFMEYCPGRIDKELWANGSAAPLFDRITKLLK